MRKARSDVATTPGSASPRLYWISPRDMRKNRADAVKIMLECDGFARLNFDVTLITPHVYRPDYRVAKRSLWDLYSLEPSFRIMELPTWLTDERGRTTRWHLLNVRVQKIVSFFIFALCLALRSLVDRRPRTLILQDIVSGSAVALVRRLLRPRWTLIHLAATFLGPISSHRRLIAQCDGVIAINDHIRDGIIRAYGVTPERVARPDPYSYHL